MKPLDPRSYRKAAWVVAAVLLMASASGYFMGLRQTGSQISLTRPVSLAPPNDERRASTSSVPVAVSYAEQDWLREGPNAQWRNRVPNLVQPVVALSALTNVTEAERTLALKDRAGRRAFDGAPPTVPHAITQDSSAACLACHGAGLAIKDRFASTISHDRYASCTQCHVASQGIGLAVDGSRLLESIAANSFVGATSPLKGSRAWPQAPPTIPHSTLMRSDCLSCHGPRGLFGLRTPHPERQACAQCHVVNADLNQHFFSAK